MKFIFFLLTPFFLQGQTAIKIKREDNRFIFFQTGLKNDSLIRNRTDQFLIKLPDSLQRSIRIDLKNAMFIACGNDSIFILRHVPGMKYSHTKHDNRFETLVDGACTPSHEIQIDFINTQKQQVFLQNKFIAK